MSARRLVVVVVDDDAGMGRAMARMIEFAGMAPVQFASAEALLANVPEVIDCAVLDVHLPGLDGIELAQRLAGTVPVIFVSASEEAEARVRALSGAPRPFLAKPFSGHALVQALERLLGDALQQRSPPARRHSW